ncbi:hypothetical protein OAV62_02050, partial [bacterium]|nr:hypothetical protein [bacterium]
MDDHHKQCAIYQRSCIERMQELEEKNWKDEIKHVKFVYDNKIRKLERDLSEMKIKFITENREKLTIQRQLDNVTKDHQELALICAKKETSTSTVINNSRNTVTNNIVNCLEAAGPLNLDKDHVKAIVDSHYTKRHLLGGQQGLASFVADNLTKNDQDQLTYMSSDRSRGTFKYLLDNGAIKTDTKAEDVINVIYDPV